MSEHDNLNGPCACGAWHTSDRKPFFKAEDLVVRSDKGVRFKTGDEIVADFNAKRDAEMERLREENARLKVNEELLRKGARVNEIGLLARIDRLRTLLGKLVKAAMPLKRRLGKIERLMPSARASEAMVRVELLKNIVAALTEIDESQLINEKISCDREGK